MEFYLWVDEQQQGPFTEGDLRERLSKGELSQETNAWRAGLREWMPLSELLAEEEARAKKAKLKISKPNEPLKMTRSHSGAAAPVLKVGSGSTQKLAKATSAVRASVTQPLGKAAAKTVSIQGSLKRGLAANLSQTASQTQLLTSATSNLVPHSATQAQTVRVTGAVATQYHQPANPAEGEMAEAGGATQANGKAVVGFVLGLLSVGIPVLCFLSLVGMFFSFAGSKNPHRAKLNLWGMILNMVGVTFFISGLIALIIFWSAIQAFLAGTTDAMQQGAEQMIPERERIENAVEKAVQEWASQNNGRAPRSGQGLVIIKELGYQDQVEYVKASGQNRYDLVFAGDDGEFGTSDDYRSPKRVQNR